MIVVVTSLLFWENNTTEKFNNKIRKSESWNY